MLLLPARIVTEMDDVQTNFEALQAWTAKQEWVPVTLTASTPTGANAVNNNILSAPSQTILNTTTVSAAGINAVGASGGYDPNGWIGGGSTFTVPAGVYKIEYTYFLNYTGAPVVNVQPAVIINGVGTSFQNAITTTGASAYQPIAGSQLVIASGTSTTWQPAVNNISGAANVGAQVVGGDWIVTRVN